jgi:hypothetical protein
MFLKTVFLFVVMYNLHLSVCSGKVSTNHVPTLSAVFFIFYGKVLISQCLAQIIVFFQLFTLYFYLMFIFIRYLNSFVTLGTHK